MRWIRIIDQDDHYASRLASFLEKRLDDCRVQTGLTGKPAPPEEVAEAEIIVAGDGYHDWKPTSEDTPVIHLSSDVAGTQSPRRLGDSMAIVHAIQFQLDACGSADAPSSPAAGNPRMVAVLSDLCDPERKRYVSGLLDQAIDNGGRAVYIPLLPSYRSTCSAFTSPARSAGADRGGFTQLLVRAGQEDLDLSDIGASLHPSRDGILCIAPAEIHDDLVLCGVDPLRRFTATVRAWLETQRDGSVVLADIAEMPDASAAAVIALCDELHLAIRLGSNGFSSSIAPLTARVSAGCKLVRVNTRVRCAPKERAPGPGVLRKGKENRS